MPTVKELIDEYGAGLVGAWVRWDGDGKLRPGSFKITTLPDKDNPNLKARLNGRGVAYVFSNDDILTIKNAPTTKTPFELLDLGFCAAMCRNWEAGIKDGRVANGWETLPRTNETRDRYVAKILRHLQRYVEQRGVAVEHLAAIACNANILWHIEGRGE
jgi:hypothetical protein